MAKMRIEASELQDTNINFVSLVKRGANQTSFKIVKGDGDGEDFRSRISGMFGKAGPEAVLAVFVDKSVADVAGEVLAKRGFSLDGPVESDNGLIMYPQGDWTVEKGLGGVVQSDQGIAYGISEDVAKRFAPYMTEGDFDDQVGAMGFYPMLDTASHTMYEMVYVAMSEADSLKEANSNVAKVMSDFTSYVKQLVGALPESAFMAEIDMMKAVGKRKGKYIPKKSDDSGSEGVAKEQDMSKISTDAPELEGVDDVSKEDTPQDSVEVRVIKAEVGGSLVDRRMKFRKDEDGSEVFLGFEDDAPEAKEPELLEGVMKVAQDGEVVERRYAYREEDGEKVFVKFIDDDDGEGASASAAVDAPELANPELLSAALAGAMEKALGPLMKGVESIGKGVEDVRKDGERLGRSLLPTSGGEDLDLALSAVGGGELADVRKSDDLWDGAMSALDNHVIGRGA